MIPAPPPRIARVLLLALLAALLSSASAQTVIWEKLAGDMFNMSGSNRADTQFEQGASFDVPVGSDYRLDSLDIALSGAQAELLLVEDDPSMSSGAEPHAPGLTVLERWTVQPTPQSSILHVPSVTQPVLRAGNLYWVVVSTMAVGGGTTRLWVSSTPMPLTLHAERWTFSGVHPLWPNVNRHGGDGLRVTATERPTCGDCNLDSQVTILDALEAAQHAAGLTTLTGTQFTACNVIGALEPDPTAAVQILDALAIAQFTAGLPATLVCW